jgi:hypothetical protein
MIRLASNYDDLSVNPWDCTKPIVASRQNLRCSIAPFAKTLYRALRVEYWYTSVHVLDHDWSILLRIFQLFIATLRSMKNSHTGAESSFICGNRSDRDLAREMLRKQ